MAYLGRPSAGDSPFAIGDKAMRDTSSPQPPSQRNPTPRQPAPSFGSMQAPSPYSSVSDEARRRYEERYQKKKADEAAKLEDEARRQNGGGPGPSAGMMAPPSGPHGRAISPGHPQHPPPQHQQQQHQYGGYNNSGPPPPAGGYQSPPLLQQQRPFSPNTQHGYPPSGSQGFNQPPPQQQYQQGPPGGYPQQPPPQQQRPASRTSVNSQHSYNSPPIHQQQQQQQQHYQQQGPPNQRYSNPTPGPAGPRPSGPGGLAGPQWSSQSIPPPSQQWENKPKSPSIPTAPPSDSGELHHMFNQFDSSRTGQLNSFDLQRLLAKDETIEAREDCVKMLMNIFDTDKSGSINFTEFEGLYRYIQDWHGIFLRFDRDNSGLIDRKELHQALLGFGFSLPSEMVRKLEKRFAPPPKPGHSPSKGITFDRFLMACVTVKHYTESFRRADPRNEGRLTLDYNTFMGMVLDAPS